MYEAPSTPSLNESLVKLTCAPEIQKTLKKLNLKPFAWDKQDNRVVRNFLGWKDDYGNIYEGQYIGDCVKDGKGILYSRD